MKKLLMMQPKGIPRHKAAAIYKMQPKTVSAGVTNIVSNGNFTNGTTGWLAYGSTISAANNILTVTGNGGGVYPQAYQIVPNKAVNGHKIYGRFRFRVTNPVCIRVTLQIYKNGGTPIGNARNSPVQNQWYPFSSIFTQTQDGDLTHVMLQEYADAATANGKVMEVQEVLSIDLTTLFESRGLTIPPLATLDALFATWFDGTKSMQIPSDLQTIVDSKGTLHGYNGSTPAPDTNDGTWNGAGMLLGADDYGSLPSMPPIESFDQVVYLPTAVNKDTTPLMGILGFGADSGVVLGSGVSTLTDEIITMILYSTDGYSDTRIGWCDAAGSIPIGYSLIQWNHVADGNWTLTLNSQAKPLTVTGTHQKIFPGTWRLGKRSTTYFFNNGIICPTVLFPETRTPAELVNSARELRAEMLRRGVTPNW
jgi:hypothetical protein